MCDEDDAVDPGPTAAEDVKIQVIAHGIGGSYGDDDNGKFAGLGPIECIDIGQKRDHDPAHAQQHKLSHREIRIEAQLRGEQEIGKSDCRARHEAHVTNDLRAGLPLAAQVRRVVGLQAFACLHDSVHPSVKRQIIHQICLTQGLVIAFLSA